ncbi:MAG: hypothetical protein ABIQ16_25940, partial [Polyangiaceae bacterium]
SAGGNSAPSQGGTGASDGGCESAGCVTLGGSAPSHAGTGTDVAGGESSAGTAGDGPLGAARWLLLEPPAPPSTPEGLTADHERNFSTRYCCSSADGSVIVGFSQYVFPDFSFKPSGEQSWPFIWREETGLKELGPISDPNHGLVTQIEPEYVTADGSRVLGSYALGEAGPGGSGPVWSTYVGGFFVWTEAQGYTRFGPPGPMRGGGHIYDFGADGKTALGQVQPDLSDSYGFLWTEANGYSLLKDLPEWPADASEVTLSRDGSSVLGITGDFRGFRWRASGLQWLGTLDPSLVCSPQVISADGAVIAGTCQDRNGSLAPITFRWGETSGLVALDANSAVQICPTEISDRGDVLLGPACDASGILHGLAYWENGVGIRQASPSANFASTYIVAARSLTADGSAAIGMRLVDDSERRAFQWTRSGGVRELPSLRAGDHAYAMSQTKDGRLIAGGAGDDAVLWDAAGIRNIGAELRSAGVDQKGWGLNAALSVTAADSIIVHGSSSKSLPNSGWPEQRVWVAWLPAR